MAAAEKQAVTGAGPFNDLLTWIDQRFPLMETWRTHLSEYYAPKRSARPSRPTSASSIPGKK